ncbi:MAG: macro domain-containing protein [Proteobacteria bacterium]|nr:macro domain-containing protein [Pseudomonadota bacterium]
MIVVEKMVKGKILRLFFGDITERDLDAIVNPANSELQHGGGVAGIIVKKGGYIIQSESDKIGYLPVGQSAITSAGALKAKFVIHTVGPIYGEGDEDNKLKEAIFNTLKLACEKGLRSISIPAISAGIFGFPKDRCAEILVNEAKSFIETNPECSLQIVEFCIYNEDVLSFFKKEFGKI